MGSASIRARSPLAVRAGIFPWLDLFARMQLGRPLDASLRNSGSSQSGAGADRASQHSLFDFTLFTGGLAAHRKVICQIFRIRGGELVSRSIERRE